MHIHIQCMLEALLNQGILFYFIFIFGEGRGENGWAIPSRNQGLLLALTSGVISTCAQK